MTERRILDFVLITDRTLAEFNRIPDWTPLFRVFQKKISNFPQSLQVNDKLMINQKGRKNKP